MLQIREIDVVGKRKAVVVSSNPDDRDEVALLEVIWSALTEYETKRRCAKGLRVRWTFSKVNDELSDIVLIYPCVFVDHEGRKARKKTIHRRKKIGN